MVESIFFYLCNKREWVRVLKLFLNDRECVNEIKLKKIRESMNNRNYVIE